LLNVCGESAGERYERLIFKGAGMTISNSFPLLVGIFFSLIISGCGRNVNINKYYDIDTTEKSITLPPGSSLLIGAFKKSLSTNGWKMSVYRGPEVEESAKGLS